MPLIHSPEGLAHWLPDESVRLERGPIGGLLRRNAEQLGSRPALKWPVGDEVAVMNYAELLERAERCASWLIENVGVGERIAVWSINRIEYAVLFYASALAGTIMAPFNQAWTDAEARHALELTRPRVLFAGRNGRYVDLRPRAEALADCPIVDLAALYALQAAEPSATLPTLDESHPYVIQFTSGTTGQAKGALLSHRTAVVGATRSYPTEDHDSSDVWLVYAPFHHIGGSCSVTLSALAAGGACVVLERFDVGQLVGLIEPTGATQLSGVPTMWFDILRNPDLPRDANIRGVTLGGAAVSPALGRDIEARTGATISIVFGQSECPVITRTGKNDDPEVRAETIGRPVPHAEVKIADPASGRTLTFGEVGEICVRGPMVMDGYWNNPEATAATIDAAGFLHTGDLGSMSADGLCRIHGRHRDLIIRGGENVYPVEVEDALLLHPDVLMAAVFGVPDARLGQEVAAAVKLRPGAQADPAVLHEHTARLVSHFKTPRHWRFVDDLPMTASGKVRKVGLAELFATAS